MKVNFDVIDNESLLPVDFNPYYVIKTKRVSIELLYHITEQRWPDSIELCPRGNGMNRGADEPLDLRICVCPTVRGCFAALGQIIAGLKLTNGEMLFSKKPVSVYVMASPDATIEKPYNVYDSDITGELWVTSPALFLKVYEFGVSEVPNYGFTSYLDPERQIEYMQKARYFDMLNKIEDTAQSVLMKHFSQNGVL